MVISYRTRLERRASLVARAREGATVIELIAEFQLGDAYIRQLLRKAGVAVTSGDGTHLAYRTHAERRARKRRLLLDASEGASLEELADKFGLEESTIRLYCYNAGVDTVWTRVRAQTVSCSVCGDTHTSNQKHLKRPVCDRPACRLEFRNVSKDSHRIYKRDLEIVQYSAGGIMTLQEIANKYDISRERIRQIILNHGGKAHSERVKTSNCGMCEKEMTCVGRIPDKFCSSECREANRERSNNLIAKAHRRRAEENDSKWARTVEKTYTCAGCGAEFSRSNYLKSITELQYSPESLVNKKMYCTHKCYRNRGSAATSTYDFFAEISTGAGVDETLSKLKHQLHDNQITVGCDYYYDDAPAAREAADIARRYRAKEPRLGPEEDE